MEIRVGIHVRRTQPHASYPYKYPKGYSFVVGEIRGNLAKEKGKDYHVHQLDCLEIVSLSELLSEAEQDVTSAKKEVERLKRLMKSDTEPKVGEEWSHRTVKAEIVATNSKYVFYVVKDDNGNESPYGLRTESFMKLYRKDLDSSPS